MCICVKGSVRRRRETAKPYDNLILQDKTGTLDGKVWDPNSSGIADYDELDFIEVFGEVTSYNNALQLNIRQIRKAYEDEYNRQITCRRLRRMKTPCIRSF